MTRIQKAPLSVALTLLLAASIPGAVNAQQYYANGVETFSIQDISLTGGPAGGSSGSNVRTSLSVDLEDDGFYATLSFGQFVAEGIVSLNIVDANDFSGTITDNNYPGPDITADFDVVAGVPVTADFSSEAFLGTYYEYQFANFQFVPEPSSISLAATGALVIAAFVGTRSVLRR